MDELMPTFIPVLVKGEIYFTPELPAYEDDIAACIGTTGQIKYFRSRELTVHPKVVEYLQGLLQGW